MLPIRVSQISELLETYMTVNFKACEISQGTYKLNRTHTLIKNKNYLKINFFSCLNFKVI